jgi:2-polyprenyl-3-methyl-5-hydroxy-6-metoxy-1,4-benzoquinol methylase
MDAALYAAYAQAEDDHWWFRGRRRVVERVLDALPLGPDARLLEVGCATGGNLALLSRYGAVDAVEMNAGAAQRARSRPGAARVWEGFLPDDLPPQAGGPYDLIALLDVLEHVPDDDASLRALFARTAPGGFLLLTVPAYGWLWSAHDDANHHQRRYRRGALVRQVRSAGFTVQQSTYFNTLLFPAIAAARMAGNALARIRPAGRASDLDAVPPPLVNRALQALFASERAVVPRFRLPLGVSILVLARRPAAL